MPSARAVLFLGAILISARALHAQDADTRDLPAKARAILAGACHRCHGNNGTVEGGFSYVLDRQQLVARKKIIPGDAAKSRLFHRVEEDEMPPDGEKPRLGKDEVALLKRWIDAGAPDFNPASADRKFIAAGEVIRFMRDDMKKRPEADRRFTRYLTLTHLYNAGRSDDELQSYRNGIAKLINSLSWGRKIVTPTPIDPARTILRIDLRDYRWTGRAWELIAGSDPYGLVHPASEIARSLYAEAGCVLPHVRGDWFVAMAARPPLYHEILQLPATEKELESILRVDVDDNIRSGQALRAGFNGSAVSRNNRVIERHESSYGYYWKSYDFARNVDRQNLFAHPLGPGTADNHFKHDGGELIFSLPNGFQGYMLVNGEGRRINKGPPEVVSDPKRPDRAVENGLSCMSCHVRGILPKDDQVRAHVEKNPSAFTEKERESILGLYPPKARFRTVLKQDEEQYRKAVERAGVQLGISEPIAALAMLFEAELDLPLAAAEANLRPAEFQRLLKESPALTRVLGNLQTPGGTVQRGTFAKAFPEMAQEWKLGTVAPRSAIVASGTSGFIELGGRHPYPADFMENDRAVGNPKGLSLNGRFYIKTRQSDYLARDFTFEIVCTVKKGGPNDTIYVGIGEATSAPPYNEPHNVVCVGVGPPNLEDGRVAMGPKPGVFPTMGKIGREGTHRIIVEKKGDVVTFAIDVDNDGPSDDDLEKTIPDIKVLGPFLNKKNTHIFFGGGGTFQRFRITE